MLLIQIIIIINAVLTFAPNNITMNIIDNTSHDDIATTNHYMRSIQNVFMTITTLLKK